MAPTQSEINQIIDLFNSGRLVELEAQARLMVGRYPGFGFAWKALGASLQMQGKDSLHAFQKAAELLPGDAEAHYNLGKVLRDLGQLEGAVASYRRALEIKPTYAMAHNNLGNVLRDLGQFDGAAASYRMALGINPNDAVAHNNLGITLKNLGQFDEAMASCRRALEIKPGYAEAYSNLGNALIGLERFSEAETHLRRAIEIKPDCAEAYGNLGNALIGLERLSEAETYLRRAVEINPDCADALNNLASFLIGKGEPMEVLGLIKTSLKIDENSEAKRIFVEYAQRMRLTSTDDNFRDILVRALTEIWGRQIALARAGANLVKLSPNIGGCAIRANKNWPQRLSAQDLFGPAGFTAVATDPLLCALLDATPIADIELERFLTTVRRVMLDAVTTAAVLGADEKSVLAFCSALARQCFINEYVFAWTGEEAVQAQALRGSLVAALEAKAPIPALWLVTVAAYFPLHSIPLAEQLMERSWPDAVTAVLAQQISEPKEERQYRTTIPRLTAIEDEISLLVQNQYEENPYPRWTRTALASKPVTIDKYFHLRFPLIQLQPLGKSCAPDILIAGCGTGRHSVDASQRFQEAHVLAVDLSLTSLSYAKRKTQELGLTSIEYAQADLLKLGSLGRSFDIIESVGVLHHLADPWAGWQVLLSLLRPGGFMKLGFYSEMARQDIVKIRDIIAKQGYGATANEIRRCRQDLVDMDTSGELANTLTSPDFFSISACRDLIFHVQEHRMTLPDIDAFLRKNSLLFLGFVFTGDTLKAYKRRFPDDHAATNLGQWHIFESENPEVFAGMYQFWIQKAG